MGSINFGHSRPHTESTFYMIFIDYTLMGTQVQRTRYAVNAFRTGELKSVGHRSSNAPLPPDEPPREESFLRNTMNPGKMAKRSNRPKMLHALANIEQWAYVVSSLLPSSS